jgi:hypothetical protein
MRFPRCHPPSLDRIRSRFPALSAVAFRSFHLPALLPPCATKHGHGWRHGASAPPVVTAYHCVVSVRELWNGCMSRSNIRSAFVEIVSSCLFFDERLFFHRKETEKETPCLFFARRTNPGPLPASRHYHAATPSYIRPAGRTEQQHQRVHGTIPSTKGTQIFCQFSK